MIVVAFDTATPDTAVGVIGAGEPVARRHEPGAGERPGHAQQLIALVDEALEVAGAGWGDVERIGVGVGPGSFTGLRIGVTTARALAQASGAPLAAVSSLRVLAAGADTGGAVLACIDARRGELFAARWHGDDELTAPAAVRPDALAGLDGVLAVGDGAIRYRSELERAGAIVPAAADGRHHVDGAVLAVLAAAAPLIDRDALQPDYVRAPDAQPRAATM